MRKLVRKKDNKRATFRKKMTFDIAFKLFKIVVDRKTRSCKRVPQASEETIRI